MKTLQRKLGTIVGCGALIAATGCEQGDAPTVTRSAQTEAATSTEALDITPTTSFAEVNQLRPDFVDEVMSLQPVRGRDRNFRFSQPSFAQAAAMPVIFHRLVDLEEPQVNRVALAGALRTNRGPWQEIALELLETEADNAVRVGLMRSLASAQPEVLAKAAELGLRDTDARVRDWGAQAAVRLFANHGGEGAAEALSLLLVERLKDEDAGVRATSVRALSFTERSVHMGSMAGLLTDDDPITRLAAVDALVRLDANQAKTLLEAANVASDPDARVARAAKRL